jgi:hypothetical protein
MTSAKERPMNTYSALRDDGIVKEPMANRAEQRAVRLLVEIDEKVVLDGVGERRSRRSFGHSIESRILWRV